MNRTCSICANSYPETEEFFYRNGKQPRGKVKWKPDCKNCHTKRRKKRFDEILTEVFGRIECKICKYDRCKQAIDCHHLDSNDKDFEPAKMRSSYLNEEKIRLELKKCVLLCATCHREVHAGIHNLTHL